MTRRSSAPPRAFVLALALSAASLVVLAQTPAPTAQPPAAQGGQPPASGAPPAPQVYVSKLWVAVPDGLPRKLESADPSSALKTTVVYYDFNAPITINAPA